VAITPPSSVINRSLTGTQPRAHTVAGSRPSTKEHRCPPTTRTRLFIQFGAACFEFEVEPERSTDPAVQLACARAFNATIATIHLVVDGRSINTYKRRFEAASPQRGVLVVPGSFFETELGYHPGDIVTFVAEGWAAVVHDMSPGRHTVREVATFTDTDDVYDVTAVINVLPSR
jgi:hypothetical protein